MTAPLSLARSGAGEPLLLLHGWGSSRRDFTAVLPALSERFEVLNVDLPGAGRSPHVTGRPTVGAITDAVERTLDAEGVGRVHVLGNSLGARVALELASRGRARSVVAIAPSGLNILPERVLQGTGMAVARLVGRTISPLMGPLSRSAVGRTALMLPMKARPWATSQEEALGLREGFADSRDWWRTLLWALLLDVPRGVGHIDCPVLLVQGTADWIAMGQTVRYLPFVPPIAVPAAARRGPRAAVRPARDGRPAGRADGGARAGSRCGRHAAVGGGVAGHRYGRRDRRPHCDSSAFR